MSDKNISQKKTDSFIAGYLYGVISRRTFEAKDTKKYKDYFHINKSWLGLPANAIMEDIKADDIVKETLEALRIGFPKKHFEITYKPYQLYIRFYFTVSDRIKEMTISQIEEELGYSIKIIN